MDKSRIALLAGLLNAFKGALIGAGAILPGISGGVLCVAMGIYKPIMELLTHPIQSLRKNFWLYLPLLLGFVAGVLGLSRLVDILFRYSAAAAIWLFIGLIAGTMPSVWRDAGREGHSSKAVLIGGIALTASLAFMLTIRGMVSTKVEANFWIWLLCGVLWGIGIICPGMSPSSIFIFMGVYQPMAAGIAGFDFSVLLPMGLGLVACVLSLSHLMSWLLKRAYAGTMHFLLGVAIASMLVIIPLDSLTSVVDALKYLLCFACGFGVAMLMELLRSKTEEPGY